MGMEYIRGQTVPHTYEGFKRDNAMGRGPIHFTMVVCTKGNGDGEFAMERESTTGLIVVSIRGNGLPEKPMAMGQKLDPMGPYGTMADGKTINRC